MALEREALTHKIEDDLALRNRNWNQLDSHLADYETHKAEYATKGNITYYVSTTGNDNNDGLTPNKALRNIQTAINKLPKHIFHNVVIQLMDGSWSDEHVNIHGFMGNGTLTIKGNEANNEACSVASFLINSCLLQIEISSLNLRSTEREAVMVVNAQRVFITNCRIVATAPEQDGIRFDYSKGVVTGCNIWNKRYAIYSRAVSQVYSDTNTGSNNSQGLTAINGAVIAKNGTQPGGNIAEATARGGVIR